MSNALSVFQQSTQIATQGGNDKDFDEMSSGGFMPRIQLMTSNSAECKAGEFPINHYALVKSDKEDLGKNVDMVPVAWRATALQSTDDGFLTSHDKNSSLFQHLIAQTKVEDSGAMYGPEFLLWIPSKKEFVTFLCGTKTARNMAASVKGLIGKPATLTSEKIETAKYTWMGPKCGACATPITAVPTPEDVNDAVEKFTTAKGNDEEWAGGGTGDSADEPTRER
ncbi:MAG: hypothetical protein GY776_06235 [Alteromonas sp.]|nr:hypothetical protein [Alteromonas sp.]